MAIRQFIQRLRDTCARAALLGGVIACLALPAPALSGTAALPGAEDPDLRAALALWLQNDEEPGLTAIARLARDGNAAARLLLAVIDKTPPLQGPWLAHLPREERIALLRQPGGLSGRSWLHALTDLPLGAAWRDLMDTATGPEVVATFAALGEARAAREALVTLAAREHPGLRSVDPARVDPDLVYVLWRGADDARRDELHAWIDPAGIQHALINGVLDPAQLPGWLEGSTAGAPLDAVCAALCPQTRARCLSGAYTALASHNALITLGTPVEALVPQDDFLSEPRGRSSVLRRILQTHDARGRRALIGQMREHDACLADVLEAEAARYRYRRPGSEGVLNGD